MAWCEKCKSIIEWVVAKNGERLPINPTEKKLIFDDETHEVACGYEVHYSTCKGKR